MHSCPEKQRSPTYQFIHFFPRFSQVINWEAGVTSDNCRGMRQEAASGQEHQASEPMHFSERQKLELNDTFIS